MKKQELLDKIKDIDGALNSPATPENFKESLRKKRAEFEEALQKLESETKPSQHPKPAPKPAVESIKAKTAKNLKKPVKTKVSAIDKLKAAQKDSAKKGATSKLLSKSKSKPKPAVSGLTRLQKKVTSKKTSAPKPSALSNLSKKAKQFNSGRTKASLIADGREKAKKPGKRTSATGKVYYEYRPNRADMVINKKPYLEDGGQIADNIQDALQIPTQGQLAIENALMTPLSVVPDTILAEGGKIDAAAMKKAENIHVFGYDTKNFDICPIAVREFTHAVQSLETVNASDTEKEALKKEAEHIDKILGISRQAINESAISRQEYSDAITALMAASMNNYRSGMLVNQFLFIPHHMTIIAAAMVDYAYEKGGLLDIPVQEEMFKDGGTVGSQQKSILELVYRPLKEALKENFSLKLKDNYAISDGSVYDYQPDIYAEYEEEDGKKVIEDILIDYTRGGKSVGSILIRRSSEKAFTVKVSLEKFDAHTSFSVPVGKKYEKGGKVSANDMDNDDEGVDLFETPELIPAKVSAILEKYSEQLEEGDYRELEKAKSELEKIGYTFEYDLNGIAYDLRKIGEKGKSEVEEDEEDDEYKKGGQIKKTVETDDKIISKKIEEIEKQIGIKLKPDTHFSGIKKHKGEFYFVVVTNDRVSESKAYDALLRLASKKNIITKVEPNGVNRLAIYFDKKKYQKGGKIDFLPAWKKGKDTQIIMVNDNILALRSKQTPDSASVLSSSVIKGALHSPLTIMPFLPHYKVRLANLKDFEEMSVEPKGYIKDNQIDFIRK